MNERSAVSHYACELSAPKIAVSEVSIPVLAGELNHSFPRSEPWALDIHRPVAPSRPSSLSGGDQFPLCKSVETGVGVKLSRLVSGGSHRDFLTSPIAVSPVSRSLSAARRWACTQPLQRSKFSSSS